MTSCNFRSLLLAAIVLSNCITWTASRHHYAHNVHQHRTRHRRQGAGLYLSASYVIPGGEGSGWGEWGEVSPCSRTCGGGVASQKRICLQLGPDGQPQCTGGDTKYFSCQTQDCPSGSQDFRAQQCSEFDDKDFRGFKYNWVPYTKTPNPCELNCMPHGERFYFRHKSKVIDGTRCNDESFDVCVNGTCQPVGCDMMLGSNAREDKCRECRGNGANCRTTSGLFDSQDLMKGYNDILLIPEGSTTIVIEEIRPSSNYLALRAKNGTYYLNGHYHIDFPRSMMIAGALWTYERSQLGYEAPDKLRCLGPTTEPLYLSLLLQDVNVGIQYEYSVPNSSAPPTDKRYNWVHEDFTPCSATCGGGFQTRNVTCRSREQLEIVDDSLCDEGLKPPTNQSCNPDPCPARWVEGPWGECSKRCGEGGVKSREVTCQKIIANGYSSIVADKECFDLLGPKPELFQECNQDAPCPTWFVGHWKPCDKLCDEGIQKRQVVCYQKKNGRIEVLDDEDCIDKKPEDEQPCMQQPCEGVDWVTTEWSGCDTCLSKVRTRVVVCSTKTRQVMNESFCSYHPRPADQEDCDKATLPPCEVQWYATQWSKCSVDCGDGVRTRKVFCGLYDGSNVQVVEDAKCAHLQKYNDTKPCTVPKEECPSQWFAGPWSACTKECGGGEQYRRIMCFRGDKEADDCDVETVFDSTQLCNTGPCDKDETLPVDAKSTPIMDEDEECEDDEDYTEVGLDELSGTTLDMMMSDTSASGYAELESTLKDTGSGFGWMKTDYLSTFEGSGYDSYSTDDTTDSTISTSTDSTGSSEITESVSISTESTEATSSSGTYSTDLISSTVTNETASSVTDATDSTTYDNTDETNPTLSGDTSSITTEETGSTATGETLTTESRISTAKETDSTGTELTDSSVTEEETASTESSETTVSSDLPETEKTDSTVSSGTDETGSTDNTESTIAKETSSTESTITEDTSSTKSTITEETSSTESTITEETSSTESTITEETSSTESTITEETSSTESTITEETSSTESTITEETSSVESSTVTESTITDNTDTEDTSSTDFTDTTESSSTTEKSSGTEESTLSSESSASSSETTEASSTSSGSESTTVSGSTISISEGSESTTSGLTTEFSSTELSTSSGLTESTEQSSTVSSELTSEVTGSSTSGSESTEVSGSTTISAESTVETTESSSSIGSESTTEEFGSTTEGSSTISEETELTSTGGTGSTEESSTTESGSTQEFTATEESTTSVFSTTEATLSTEVSGSTTEGLSTTESEGSLLISGSTPWTIETTLGHKPRFCKPRRKPKCNKSLFGCCPDKKTAATGPFDEGCPKPHTCKESTYGCCPDGLSPAQGDNNEGCPIEPCADTLFGCCLSDNKTAAQGNDQDGCPPPPPACMSSKYGCCADNETESTGPKKQGCPESETTTTAAETETTTETSESSEASEGSTTSEGTTAVISSTTLETCSSSPFGCCFDNETEATGPDGQGCPCNATEFGCCPDGISPAQGVELQGCPGPCSTSQHGCCQDGETPAHGPEYEGCCLLTAFGCCPDNRKPAEGPHLEGCGCQYSLHGCCPDNVTIAQGPGNQGCGCQYTEHGCCPDRHTPASGPNYEGCSCHTYQFGCCPDGVTIAKAQDQQDCHCRHSTYGCCDDGETPATGPDAAGCDCSSSKHGCCPDGRTAATGPKFLGCTDAPENKQAVCSLATDPGPCHNFTAVWFYDLEYGGCSRFWYGGCEGNGNRFATKEECEDVCVQPAPKDACKLPSVKGPCSYDYVRWHYNSTHEQCIPFRYGGCLGNSNNFNTQELCQKQCEPERAADQCDLPIEQGSCAGNFSRWGYVKESQRCEQFIWGGCEGNSNRFSTEAACQMRCNPPGTLKPECTEPQAAGNCKEKEALWSFSQSENRCLPFYYSGCGGNGNRFSSREACEQTCPSAYVPDKCTLPAETGECSNYREKWFYDTGIKRCRLFYYGGCGGNANNFATEAECDSTCSEVIPTTTTTARPATQPQQPAFQQPQPEPERPDFCLLAIDSGPCSEMETRYAYDSDLGKCKTFQYGGCGGNRNNFPNEEYCTYYCHPIQDICQLPMLSGPCDESLMRWFYDPTTDSCSQFTYGGCEGNGNRFESREACESRCRTGPALTTQRTTVTTLASTTVALDSRIGEELPPECKIPDSLEKCSFGGTVWYFDQNRHECVSAQVDAQSDLQPEAVCTNPGTFTSQEACERSCGAFRGVDVCQQLVDPGPCQQYVTKVYFDAEAGRCHEFAYGGCLGGANRFSSIEECSQVCNVDIDICTLPPEQGNCFAYIPQWYYDASSDRCNQFVYTGCSGNGNRFETQRDCETRCKSATPVAHTTTTTAPVVPPQQPSVPECTTPASLEACGENITAFYYDSENQRCVVSGIGGCGHPNTYHTEEECERRCGEFRGVDVCRAPLDPGPCSDSVPKFYWDAVTGSCQQFAYGGCAGGPNRFSTIEDCENVCGETGPARECLQEVDTGEPCDAAPSRRWHYSIAHVDCVVFIYQGCGGNDNKFRSYAQCAQACKLPRRGGDVSNEVVPRDCDTFKKNCDTLDCQYGIRRVLEDGCQRCECIEDPCVKANCRPDERCEATASRDPVTQEPQYTARCVPDYESNAILPDCEQYDTDCANLRCEYGVQRMRTPSGCERCACVQVDGNCERLLAECERLKCNYGVLRTTDVNGCERCTCKDHPCADKTCPAGERCVVTAYRNAIDEETLNSSECRSVNKPGMCPADDTTSNHVTCHQACRDDADCRGVGKCCRRGCSDICLPPVESTSQNPLLTTTYAPDVPAAPTAVQQVEAPVEGGEGGTATLRCLFHGNPPPKITWRRGELTIDGNVGRYRLKSDGALEIVSLYRNDTGVYICVADNGLGVAMQEIHLVVNDPVNTPVGIAGDENAVVTGELGKPLAVRCLAYGYPPPTVFWYRGLEGTMVPYNDAVYEARGNVLLIRSLAIETLGEYTCQAYNGEGKAASWVVAVQAYRPEGIFVEHEFLVPRYTVAPMAKTNAPTTRETTTTTSTTTELPIPLFTVPVSTHVSTEFSTVNIGSVLQLQCEVDGYPDPDVYWTKDGARIVTDDRITITGSTIVSRLTVSRVTVSDSGVYACHASNAYSSHSSSAQINVLQLVVPAKCTDNPFFANCDLIVRSKFCRHKYYSKFCCKSCVEAGQLDPQEAELQADQPFRRK